MSNQERAIQSGCHDGSYLPGMLVRARLVDFYKSLLQLSSSRILFKYTSNRTKEFLVEYSITLKDVSQYYHSLQAGQMGDSILFLVLGIFLLIQMLAVADLLNTAADILSWFIEEVNEYRHTDYPARQRQESLERNQVLPEDLVIPFALMGFGLLFVFSAKI
jgi:hypothetical protein